MLSDAVRGDRVAKKQQTAAKTPALVSPPECRDEAGASIVFT